jgi:hypothetical protein
LRPQVVTLQLSINFESMEIFCNFAKNMKIRLIILLLFVGCGLQAQFSPTFDTVRFYRGTAVGSKIFYLRINGDTLFLNSDTLYTSASPGDTNYWALNGTDIYRKDGLSNVGIGTSSPDELLHVSGGNIEIDEWFAIIQNDTNLIRRYKTNYFIGDNITKLTTGVDNTFVGHGAGDSIKTGSYNTFLGTDAGEWNETGSYNTGIGHNSQGGVDNASGDYNTSLGYGAGRLFYTGSNNTAIGVFSGSNQLNNKDASTYVGAYSGQWNNGANNAVLGAYAGKGTFGQSFDSCLVGGAYAGYKMTTATNNVFLGYKSGYNITTGSSNVFIGYKAGYSETGSNKLYIENSNSATPLIYGDFDKDTVVINGDLAVTGGFTIPTGANNGYVWTSDANGVGSWQTVGGGSSVGNPDSLCSKQCNYYLDSTDMVWKKTGTVTHLYTLAGGSNAGNVGIGTSTAPERLTVDGDIQADTIFAKHDFDDTYNKPTTLAGYGITDARGSNTWQQEVANDTDNNWTVSFTLSSNSVISYNGMELPSSQWSGVGTTTLNVSCVTYKYDKITVIQ